MRQTVAKPMPTAMLKEIFKGEDENGDEEASADD